MKSKLLILIIALLSTLSCKSTKMTTVFKCDDIECLKKFMGEPTKITENNNGEIWEYFDDRGGYSKFYIDNENRISDTETSYVTKRASSASIWVIFGGAVIGAFAIGLAQGGG